MLFFDDTMLKTFREENPEATSLEIISFLRGIKAVMTKIESVLDDNHIMVIPKTHDEKIEEAMSNIIEFPGFNSNESGDNKCP